MTDRPSETTKFHTRLLNAALAVADCRAYWAARRTNAIPTPETAFEKYWFGAKSLPWLRKLLVDMRARFDAFPSAIRVLAAWEDMSAGTRTSICHWHLQLADPLYRRFTSEFLPDRTEGGFQTVKRSVIARWINDVCPDRWQNTTRNEFAKKLVSAAADVGILRRESKNEWRTGTPRVDDTALIYLLHLLNEIDFAGTLTENSCLRSVGIDSVTLASRLQKSSAITIHCQGQLTDVTWQHQSLIEWASAVGIFRTSVNRDVA